MASNTKRTETIRRRKRSPNKINLKAEQRRLRKNLDVLAKVVEEA